MNETEMESDVVAPPLQPQFVTLFPPWSPPPSQKNLTINPDEKESDEWGMVACDVVAPEAPLSKWEKVKQAIMKKRPSPAAVASKPPPAPPSPLFRATSDGWITWSELSFLQYATLTGKDSGTGPAKVITGSGLAKFFEDIHVASDSLDAIVVCYSLHCSRPLTITEEEYQVLQGLTGCHEVTKMIPKWRRNILTTNVQMRSFFLFCFMLLREEVRRKCATGTVILSHETARSWGSVIPFLFLQFPVAVLLSFTNSYQKPITSDSWRGVFDLMTAHPSGDFTAFTHEGSAWPPFVDEFVKEAQTNKSTKDEYSAPKLIRELYGNSL